MADKKISELPSITGANVDDANDTLPIVDASTDTTKQITRAELFKGIDGSVGIGTSSPSNVLTVSATGLSTPALIESTSTVSRISFKDTATTDANTVRLGSAGDDMSFLAGGSEAMRIDSSGNVGIGTSSPSAPLDVNGDAEINGLTVGRGSGGVSSNTAVGSDALVSNTTGDNNTASGYSALYSNTTGSTNSAFGRDALWYNTTGSSNTSSGYRSLYNNTTGINNTASGYLALKLNTTGINNTASGFQALLSNTTGDNNVAVGVNSLRLNTEGQKNTAVGRDTLYANTTGDHNTASGYQALNKNTTGSSNVAVGRSALYNNTTGSGNFGAAFRNSSGTYAPVFNPSTESNRVVMGHTGITNAYVQVAWTVVSDARDKTEIEALEKGLDFVEQLNPVSYKFRKDRDTDETTGKKRYGFLAQEVLEVEGDDNVIVDTEDLDKLKMTHEELIPVLVKAIQELKAEVDLLKAQ